MRILIKRIFPGMYKRWAAHRNRKADLGAYKRWLKHHPGCTFKDFYVETIQGHLFGEQGPHSTLGPQPVWENKGDAILHRLIGLGLRPSDIVVDYGCGTLREGKHLIRYLDAGHYIGLDIDERVLDAGRRLVEPALIAEKRPQLAVINRKVVSEVAATKPAWIVSSYVLSQMPPQELEEYFNNLLQFMEGGGKAILQVRLAWRTMQYARTGWYHSRGRMAKRLAKRGLEVLAAGTRPLTSKRYKVRGVEMRLIVAKRTRCGDAIGSAGVGGVMKA
jgi:SAM-dependent methyltransferase